MSFDIFTVLGHDLKSPLNAVESYLEIIRGKVLGDQTRPLHADRWRIPSRGCTRCASSSPMSWTGRGSRTAILFARP